MANNITNEELADYVARMLPLTYAEWERHKEQDGEVNTASWARGRIDGLLQILNVVDKARGDELSKQWGDVVEGRTTAIPPDDND